MSTTKAMRELLLFEFGSHEESYTSIEGAYDTIMIEKVSDFYSILFDVFFESSKYSLRFVLRKL